MRTTVLIVDDDPHIRRILAIALAQGAFEVVGEAADGKEAVSLAAAHKPAVVILDQEMPHMKGDAAAAILRQTLPQTKVIACSNAFVVKPDWADAFLPKDLLAEAEGVLQACCG
jgi:YesN/AraC family two-component response regulator